MSKINLTDFSAIFARLTFIYKWDFVDNQELTCKEWYRSLADYTAHQLNKAVDDWLRNNRTAPTVADIVSLAEGTPQNRSKTTTDNKVLWELRGPVSISLYDEKGKKCGEKIEIMTVNEVLAPETDTADMVRRYFARTEPDIGKYEVVRGMTSEELFAERPVESLSMKKRKMPKEIEDRLKGMGIGNKTEEKKVEQPTRPVIPTRTKEEHEAIVRQQAADIQKQQKQEELEL